MDSDSSLSEDRNRKQGSTNLPAKEVVEATIGGPASRMTQEGPDRTGSGTEKNSATGDTQHAKNQWGSEATKTSGIIQGK